MRGKFKYSGVIVLFFFFLAGNSAQAHKFYVSLCRIRYVRDSSQLQIVMKIFTDDLERALSEMGGSPVTLEAGGDAGVHDSLVAAYLLGHFHLFSRGKEVPLHYLGKEVEYDVTWCYLESQTEPGLQELTVENDILTEVYPSQINLVEVSYGGKKKGVMLDRDKIRDSLLLD